MNSVTDSTQNDLTCGHRCLTAWVLEKDHNITKDTCSLVKILIRT